MTVRDLRQRWPQAERSLLTEREIVITRDGQPVAKLVRLVERKLRRTRWDPEKHAARIRKILGNRVFESADPRLASDRADRVL
jgi:antitoxin (DNA-binding transcriptional repressor) of toxin-antitoxin stability system